ncbi:MAG TPA: hypothetical protein VM285_01455 [Polyangia bacterium]|nr:hypothetical protein [Polyangia bacterium]
MANFRKPSDKASETVTFRLRPAERRLFEHLAEVGGIGLSELLRSLILRRAGELGINQAPAPLPRRGPGRPRKLRTPAAAAPAPEVDSPGATPMEVSIPVAPPRAAPSLGASFSDIIDRFLEHFGDRGEGTRRELAETVDFLTAARDGGPILPRETAVEEIDSACMEAARERIAALDIRMSRKNLYLTYLRMMMHFAVKRPGPRPAVNPVLDLEPLTMRELGSWPAPSCPAGEVP